jgi:hypothetical protein
LPEVQELEGRDNLQSPYLSDGRGTLLSGASLDEVKGLGAGNVNEMLWIDSVAV